MNWFIFALLTLFSSILYSLVLKKLITPKGSDPIIYGSFEIFSVAIMTLPFIAKTGFEFTGTLLQIFMLPLMGLTYALATFFMYTAIKELPLSEMVILTGTSVFWALIGGTVFLQEKFSLLKLFASCLIFFSIILVEYQKKKLKLSKYAIFAILSAMFFQGGALFDKYLVQFFNNFGYQFFNFILPAIFILFLKPASFKKMGGYIKEKKNLLYPFFSAILLFLSFVFLFKAYKAGGEVSIITPILGTKSIFVVLSSLIILKEKERVWQKIVAAILTFTALLMLAQ